MISLFFEELRSSIGNCETAISQSSIRPLLEQNQTDEGIYRSPAAQRLLGFVCVFLNTEKLSKQAFIFSLAGEEAAMDLISSLILSPIYIEGAMLVIGVLKNSPPAKVSLPLLQTHFLGSVSPKNPFVLKGNQVVCQIFHYTLYSFLKRGDFCGDEAHWRQSLKFTDVISLLGISSGDRA